MKAWSVSFFCLSVASITICSGSQTLDEARRLERSGEAVRARGLLAKAAQSSPHDATALGEYAEFLDRYGDPGCREAYRKLLEALGSSGDSGRKTEVAKRLMVLDLLAGDKTAAGHDL